MNKNYLFLKSLLLACFVALGSSSYAYNLTVAKDGSGDYTTIQAAIDAAPAGQTSQYTIFIKNGKYRGKINIPSNKPFLKLIGEDVANVIITNDDYNGKFNPAAGGTLGTSNSATVLIGANDFTAVNITFENTTGDNPQAVAVNANGTRSAFLNCRFLGGQDTLYTNNDGSSQYYRNCYFDGDVDFIFGGAKAVFDSCIIYPKTRVGGGGGTFTAASTPTGQAYGYVFRNCKIMSNFGNSTYILGRPWGNSTGNNPQASNKVVFINTTMSYTIVPAGWAVWDAGTVTSLIYFAEYQSRNIDGSLANVSQRLPWTYQMSATDAATYTNTNIFGSWDPCTAIGCGAFTPGIAVANLKATAGSTQSTIRWNICWPISGVQYDLFRSKDSITYSKIYTTTSANDTNLNFQTTDTLPATGGTWFYYVKASKTGLTTEITDTVKLGIASNILITNALGGFLQGSGTPSPVQKYTVSGINITGGITITPPASYEISTDNGTTWNNSASPVTLNATGTTVAATIVSVRLNASVAGTYSGNFTHTTANHAVINQKVNGTTLPTTIPPDSVLVYFPYTANNSDSASFRAPFVATGKDTMYRYSLANGTTVPGVPAYSMTHGKAISANNSGDGTWSAAFATLNRSVFDQISITSNAATYGLLVTSMQLNAAMYRSTVGKMALSFSTDNFANDSNSFTYALSGSNSLPLSANGTFATPVLLNNDTTGTSTNYSFQFNGNAGVIVPPGKKLSVRIYISSTNGQGYYAKLKDVYLRGNSIVVPVNNHVNVNPANSPEQAISLYPNPVLGIFTIAYPSVKNGSMLQIYQMDGKLALQQPLTENSTKTQINTGRMIPGNYIVVINNGGQISKVKFTKE